MSSEKKSILRKSKNLSVVIIAKDEEKNICNCIRSVSWADEVIVVDSGSTDETISKAQKSGAKVFKYEKAKGTYSDWRNFGIRKAKGKWILYVDADERITPGLRAEILEKINPNNCEEEFCSFAIPRKNLVFGKELRHGGFWPDYVKRLFRKDKLKGWVGKLHEEPTFEGKLGILKNPLIHYKENSLEEMLEKTNVWSDIEAELMFEANHPPVNIFRFISAILREFWFRFVREKAFLDKEVGVIYGIYQIYSRFISYAKLWEMQLENQISSTKKKTKRGSGYF